MTKGAGGRTRFLVVAPAIPLESAGTSIVLRRLLENFDAEEVMLIGPPPDRHSRLATEAPHYRVSRIPALPAGIRGDRYWRLATALPGLATGLRAIRRFRAQVILAIFPYEGSILLGYWLHRLTGLPLLPYFCDLYMEDRKGWQALLARWLQPRVFEAAASVLAVNKGMVAFYRERYGLDAVCLPTCINLPIPQFSPLPHAASPFVVGYSGGINATRLGSLRALVAAVGNDPGFVIRYFTPQDSRTIRAWGLEAKNTEVTFIADEAKLIGELQRCDTLFLPLTFDVGEHSYDQLATCFGIKSYEYFLARRPVVVHAPRDYFIARFYRQWDCGLVVDDPSPRALSAGLRSLHSDADLRTRLVRNALRAAATFEGHRVAATLRTVLGEAAGDGPGRRP